MIVVNSNISLNLTAPDCDWEESGSLKKQAHGCASVTVGTKAYVFGGRDAESQYLNTMQVSLPNSALQPPPTPQPLPTQLPTQPLRPLTQVPDPSVPSGGGFVEQ